MSAIIRIVLFHQLCGNLDMYVVLMDETIVELGSGETTLHVNRKCTQILVSMQIHASMCEPILLKCASTPSCEDVDFGSNHWVTYMAQKIKVM